MYINVYKLKMNPGNKVVIEIMARAKRNSWFIDNTILFCLLCFSFDLSSYFHTASIYTTNRQHQIQHRDTHFLSSCVEVGKPVHFRNTISCGNRIAMFLFSLKHVTRPL